MTAKAPSPQNGTATHDEFPVDSFRDAAKHLRRPFTVEAVKFKPQSVTKDGSRTMCVAYVDARLVVERLNLVCPHLWHDAYEPTANGLMWCHLTVDGITRRDVGEGKGKALVSDALKRAAVHFGIGVSLYAIPTMFLSGKIEQLYPDGTQYAELRKRYRTWLDSHGREAFGEPLNHGDVEDHQGDPAEAPPGVESQPAPVEPVAALDDERAEGLDKLAHDIVDTEVWTRRKLGTALRGAGATDTTSVSAAIRTLTIEAADELAQTMDALLTAHEQAAA